MPKKDDLSIVRARDFQQVDEDLTAAMSSLDEANLKIEELLNSTHADVEQSSNVDANADDGEADDGAEVPSEDEASA